MRLFHITSADEWQAAQAVGEYRPKAFARDGFIHCSYADQIVGTANRFYRGVGDLVVLEIDPALIPCRVVEENLEGGSHLFPHIYGPLPVPAVWAVYPFPCAQDGTFSPQALPAVFPEQRWSCCPLLASAVARAGERGISVLVAGSPVGLYLVMQARGVSSDDEETFKTAIPSVVTLVSATQAISYCPWCGMSLSQLLNFHPGDFAELAVVHRAVLTGWSQ